MWTDKCLQNGESSSSEAHSPPFEGGESLCELSVCVGNGASSSVFLPSEHFKENSESVKDCSKPDVKGLSPLNDDLDPQTSKRLLTIFNDELPSNTFTKTFLQSILTSVGSPDPVVANAWMETLLDVIDLLPDIIIREEILTLALNKGQVSQTVSSHLLACRMLGKLCTKFDPYTIKKEVLPVVLSLCQDGDSEVRGCICHQLHCVSRGIGLESTKSAILPELVELSNDSDSCVRVAVIETVVQMLPLLDDETTSQILVPLVQKLCENSLRAEELSLPVISKKFGELCLGLSRNLNPSQRSWFLDYFRKVAKLGLPSAGETTTHYSPMPDLVPELENKDRQRQCRCSCAFNFPALVLFASPANFAMELKNTCSELCCDPFPNVRKTMALGFREVAKLLKDYDTSVILSDLISLLNDDSLEVLKGLVPNLPEILKLICQGKCELSTEASRDLVQALIASMEATAFSSNWRLHAELLTQMSCLPECLSPEIVYTTFVPMLFIKLHTCRPIPCRMAAAYSLLILLRKTRKLEDRNGIINELIRELCKGRSCYKRMLFIKVCKLITDLFSNAFFKRHFFIPVLTLSEDPVPNIRLQLCAILPKLKSMMKLPKDGILLEKLECCVKNLMTTEKDRDVCEAINKAIEELDKIEVPTETTSRRFSSTSEDDVNDSRKEDEEKQLLEMELKSRLFEEPGTFCSHLVTRSLTRQGKIPIRSTSTLPKISRPKDLRSSTLTRASPGISRRASKSINLAERNGVDLPNKSSSREYARKCENQISSTFIGSQPLVFNGYTSPKTLAKIVARCPSPMILSRRSHHRSALDNIQPSSKLRENHDRLTSPRRLSGIVTTDEPKIRSSPSPSPPISRIPTPKPR